MVMVVTGNYAEMEEQVSAPSAAPTGRVRLYAHNGAVQAIDDAGAAYNMVASLDNIADVNAPAPNDGDALVWDSGTSKWVPVAMAFNLDDLADVNAPTPSDGNALIWDSGTSVWIPGSAGDPNFVGYAAPAIPPVASGAYSIAVGHASTASGLLSTAISGRATATASLAMGGAMADADYQIVIGRNATSNNLSPGSVAIGQNAHGHSTNGVAIGARAEVTGGTGAIAIGNTAQTVGAASYSIAIGVGAAVYSGVTGAVSLGWTSIASGAYGCALGSFCRAARMASALGYSAQALGYMSSAVGTLAKATAGYSVAFGNWSNPKNEGEFQFASGRFLGGTVSDRPGSATESLFVCLGQTTDATPLILSPTGDGLNHILMANIQVAQFEVRVVATDQATADSFSQVFRGAVKLGGLVGSVTSVERHEDAGATTWAVSITYNGTDNALQIQVTGEAAHNIQWVASVRLAGLKVLV